MSFKELESVVSRGYAQSVVCNYFRMYGSHSCDGLDEDVRLHTVVCFDKTS